MCVSKYYISNQKTLYCPSEGDLSLMWLQSERGEGLCVTGVTGCRELILIQEHLELRKLYQDVMLKESIYMLRSAVICLVITGHIFCYFTNRQVWVMFVPLSVHWTCDQLLAQEHVVFTASFRWHQKMIQCFNTTWQWYSVFRWFTLNLNQQ